MKRKRLNQIGRKGKLWHSSVREIDQKLRTKRYHKVGTRKGLEQLADRVLAKFVKLRDGHCVLCGSGYQLEAGHFYKRRFESIRWLAMNLHALCHRCNQRDNEDHKHYERFMEQVYSPDELLQLAILKENPAKLQDDELRALIKNTKSAIKTLEATF